MGVSKHGLSKSLRQVDILVLSFGAMIGWSWVVLISQLMLRAGSVGAIVATLIAGGVIIVIGMIYAELTAAMPEVGGEHAYSLRAMGKQPHFIAPSQLFLLIFPSLRLRPWHCLVC